MHPLGWKKSIFQEGLGAEGGRRRGKWELAKEGHRVVDYQESKGISIWSAAVNSCFTVFLVSEMTKATLEGHEEEFCWVWAYYLEESLARYLVTIILG